MLRVVLRCMFIATALLLAGCQVTASVFEEPTLRGIALFVLVAGLLGLLVVRMRR